MPYSEKSNVFFLRTISNT